MKLTIEPSRLAVLVAAFAVILVTASRFPVLPAFSNLLQTAPAESHAQKTASASVRDSILLDSNPFEAIASTRASAEREQTNARELDVELRGILHLSGNIRGAAIVAEAGEIRRVRVGDRIGDDAELLEIHASHIVVSHDGSHQSITLSSPRTTAHSNHGRSTPSDRFALNPGVRGYSTDYED